MDTQTQKPGIANGPTYPQGVGPMGVSMDGLANLPQDLRRRALEALTDLETAIAQSNPDLSADATQRLTGVYSEICRLRADKMMTSIFADVPRASGTHNVMKFFAHRAGVKAA